MKDAEDIFEYKYRNNSWKGKESRSGPSSGMQRTSVLRSRLLEIVEDYNIQTFLDLPCGDFFWMQSIAHDMRVRYIGADIVKGIVDDNTKTFASDKVSFMHLDLVSDTLPEADILFCRDCLFHLSYADIFSALKNVLSSDIKYFMTTSHKNLTGFTNKNIKTGGWRYIDLFQEPFNFPTEVLEKVEDGGGDRYMFMWDVNKLKGSIRLAL